ncbi:MAG: hypothetical protein H0T54_05740 [Geodermatophilaceae bacterium]|nr:hypothetical protein [Geodermatophilaceae bacterium]
MIEPPLNELEAVNAAVLLALRFGIKLDAPTPSVSVTMPIPTRTFLFLALAALPASLAGQGVTVQSSSDVRLQGVLGAAANIAARFGGPSTHDIGTTMYLSGHKLRTESGNTATIIDADAGRLTTIDTKEQTYTSITFEEMAAAMRKAQQAMKESKSEPRAATAPRDPSAPKDSLSVTYRVETDRPGQRETIAGYDAERMLLTITMQGDVTPEGGKTEQAGSLVVLLDQWIAKDAPQTKVMAEFQRAYAKKAGQSFKNQVQGLSALFTSNPQMKGGLDAAAKEMAKMQGIPLRSVTYLTTVPAGQQFDRKLVLPQASAADAEAKAKQEEKPKEGGGLGGMFGRLKSAAADARKMGESKPDGPPKQGTIATITDEVKSITAGALPASMFVPPAGYREIKAQHATPE